MAFGTSETRPQKQELAFEVSTRIDAVPFEQTFFKKLIDILRRDYTRVCILLGTR